MKKLTTLAILSILLSACNKETKTITTTDPKTGKTITKEVPVAEEKPAEELAIKDTDGVFSQSLKLVKGETYPLITVQKNTQSITAPDGQKVSANSQSTDEMSFKIEDFKDGVYDITINLIG
ncbi:MAG: hypothetical protein Q4C75_04130, partial [Bergeyella zoohelcum]|nr:hypothetical protein [Bergeyella zoohelcum]